MKPNLSVISKIIFISLFIFTNTFSLWGSIFSINSVQAAPTLTTYVVPAISDHKILPKAPVETKYLSDRIDTHVAKDEYKALSFVVNSSENISDFQVEASDLTGQGGTISASNIDIRAVKVWYQSNFLASVTSTSGRYLTPELLLKDDSLVRVIGDDWTSWSASNPAGKNELKVNGAYQDISDGSVKVTDRTITPIVDRPIQDATSLQPLNLPANYNKQYWITLHIPQTANAGDYTATISLKNSTTTFKNLNLNVKVLSFVLPASDLEYSIYYRGRITGSGSISSEDKTAEQFAAEQANMAKHGLKNPTVYKPGTDEALLSELDLRRQNGIDNSNLYLLSLATSDVAKYKVLTAPYGVSNLYKYGPDEKDLNTITGRADIQAVHDAGGKYFNAQTSALADGVADVLDLAVVFQSPDKALAQKYHNYGNRVFSYANPQVGPEYPEIFRYNYGLLLWQNNYDGAMDYAYQDSAGDTWNDFDNTTHRDHNFTYPTANGVIDTVQWEGFREGINDTRYLKQLKISIAEAKTRGDKAALVSEAETYINNLKTALTQQNLVAARTQITNYIMGLDVNPQYHLTVNGGTGSGYYTLGTKVNIAANPAVAGATFAAWSGDTGSVQISGAPNTTVTIPDNAISLTATYIFNNWTEPTYSYKKTIAIDHTKVINSDQTNFPVLVSFTDPDLRTVANGGHVQNSNGYDMLFTLPDGTKLDYEVEKYDALTGQLIAWIKVPLLYTSQDTYLNLYYGNPNIVSSQANPTGVWTSSYKGVWHLNETDTGQVGDYKDSTANAFHSTNIIEQPTVTEGKITTGQAFTGATGREVIETSGTDGLNISNAITLSGWVKLDSFIGNAYEGLIYKKNNKDSIQSTAYGLTLDYSTSNVVLFASTDVKFGSTLKSRTQLQTGQWYYLTATYDSQSSISEMYINGVLDNTSPTNIQGTILPGETATPGVFNPTVLGKGSQRISLDGLLDEARISSTARSADWIKTEYLNQSSPSTFYTLGVEESSADPTLSSLTTSLSTGNYSTGQVLPLTANFDKPVSGNLTFTFTLDGNQTRTCSTTITNATNVTCNYTVQSNDQTSKLTPTLTGSIQDIYGNQLNTFTPTTNEFNSKTISLNLNGGGGGSVPTFPVLTPNFSETNGQLTITNLPSDITQFVISDNPDLTNASWQPISGLSTSLNTFPNATPLYFKFQTRDGAQSTVYTYNRDLNHPLPPHCTYSDGTLIKTDSSIKVYVVKDCKKKWIPTPEVLEQLNYQWTDIKTLSSTQLNALSDYEDNLIRAFNDYKVYLVVNGTKRHIPNPNIFLNYGFKWEDVKDVNPTVIDSYRDAYLLRASKTNPIYFFTRGIRKYIPTMDIFNSYQDKTEDIQVISQYEMDHYPNSTLVKLENTNDIYLITDNYTTRRRIPNPTIFNKHRFNWNHVISVNPFEFYYYRWGSEVR